MSEAVNKFLNSLPRSDVADKTRENNTTNQYYWMLNKHKRQVPVPVDNVNDYFMRGFQHTDGVIYSDDLSQGIDVTRKAKVSKEEMIANAMEAVAKAITPKEVEPKEVKRKNPKFVKREDLEAEAKEKGFTEEEIMACESKEELDSLIVSR